MNFNNSITEVYNDDLNCGSALEGEVTGTAVPGLPMQNWTSSAVNVMDNTSSVAQSIAALESIISDRTKNDSLETYHSSISILLDFLQSLIDAKDVPPTVLSQHVFGRILRPSFLSQLFEHRHVCNLKAADKLPPQSSDSGFICWVDVVIARLGEAILWISGQGYFLRDVDCSRSFEELALDAYMNSPEQKEQLVRVASQLPVTWQATVAVSGSEHVSEAARRLALSLMFGAYVLHPKLASESDRLSYTVASPCTDIPHTALQKFICNISREWLTQGDDAPPSTHSNPHGADIMNKCQYAMAVSVFAQLEMTRENFESQPFVTFRPSTLGAIIMLIEFLMNDATCKSTAPIQRCALLRNVYPNHCRLFGWGLTVPWCWLLWGSESSVHFETVIQITVTWLQHFATDADTEAILQTAPLAAMTIFLTLITHPICESFELAERHVLYKACRAISYLSQRYRHKLDDTLIIRAYQNLFTLLVSLGVDDIDMSSREVILELFSCIPRPLAETALSFSDTVSVSAIVDDAIAYITGVSNTPEVGDRGRRVKTSLEVLVILSWNGIPGASYLADNQSLVAHISSRLGKNDSSWDQATQETGILLLGCMASLTSGSETSIHQPALICTSMMSHVSSDDLTMAAAIAVYIHGVAKPNFLDSVTLIEVWDYLRDVLILILGMRKPENLHPLASLIRNTICSTLSLILAHVPHDHIRVLMNSPWTLTLFNELRSGSQQLGDDSPTTKLTVDKLLEQIEQVVKAKPEVKSLPFQQVHVPVRLSVHRTAKEYHLLGIAVE